MHELVEDDWMEMDLTLDDEMLPGMVALFTVLRNPKQLSSELGILTSLSEERNLENL